MGDEREELFRRSSNTLLSLLFLYRLFPSPIPAHHPPPPHPFARPLSLPVSDALYVLRRYDILRNLVLGRGR